MRMTRQWSRLSLISALTLLAMGCSSKAPPSGIPAVESNIAGTTSPDTHFGFSDPPAPVVGGKPLPFPTNDQEDDVIDCDDAENLCDAGAMPCDDVADHCDIGPDGGELPEDLDWDS